MKEETTWETKFREGENWNGSSKNKTGLDSIRIHTKWQPVVNTALNLSIL